MSALDRSFVRVCKLGEEPSWVDEHLLAYKRASGASRDLAYVEEFDRSEKHRR